MGSQRVTPTPSLASDELPIAPTIIFSAMTHDDMTTLWPGLIPDLLSACPHKVWLTMSREKVRGAQLVCYCLCYNLFTHRSASKVVVARHCKLLGEEPVDTQRGKNSDKAPLCPTALPGVTLLCKMYLSKLGNVFVLIVKCICPVCEIYLFKKQEQ